MTVKRSVYFLAPNLGAIFYKQRCHQLRRLFWMVRCLKGITWYSRSPLTSDLQRKEASVMFIGVAVPI